MTAGRLIVWRHGRTEWNLQDKIQGQADIPLDDIGLAQAREAASRLASLAPTRLFASDLQRAAATAGELALPGARVIGGGSSMAQHDHALGGHSWSAPAAAWTCSGSGIVGQSRQSRSRA